MCTCCTSDGCKNVMVSRLQPRTGCPHFCPFLRQWPLTLREERDGSSAIRCTRTRSRDAARPSRSNNKRQPYGSGNCHNTFIDACRNTGGRDVTRCKDAQGVQSPLRRFILAVMPSERCLKGPVVAYPKNTFQTSAQQGGARSPDSTCTNENCRDRQIQW